MVSEQVYPFPLKVTQSPSEQQMTAILNLQNNHSSTHKATTMALLANNFRILCGTSFLAFLVDLRCPGSPGCIGIYRLCFAPEGNRGPSVSLYLMLRRLVVLDQCSGASAPCSRYGLASSGFSQDVDEDEGGLAAPLYLSLLKFK